MDASLQTLIQLVVIGLAWGSIYALIALGFVVIFKSTDIFNFAQGEIMMVGAYIAFSQVTLLQLPYLPAFLITLGFIAVLAALMEMLVIRPMVGEPIFSVIMVTLGLGNVLRGAVGLIWGFDEYALPTPFPTDPLSLFGITLQHGHLYTILLTLLLLLTFFLFFKYSSLGIAMRATAEDQEAAFLMGMSVKRIFTLSWAIAALVAAIAGIFLAGVSYLKPVMSFTGMRALPAVILGGMDSIPGAILGGLIIGVAENLAGFYLEDLLGGGIQEIAAYAIVILIMMIRPYGLFGAKEIERV